MTPTARSIARAEETSETRLVWRFAHGDQAAASELFLAYCDPLLRFVLRRTHLCIEDAEDVVNATFVAALDLGQTYDGSCSVFTWLCCLARYRIADELRRSHAKHRVPGSLQVSIDDASGQALRDLLDPRTSVDAILDRLDCASLVRSLLNALSPDQREAVITRYMDGFSVEETAKILGKSPKAIERLIERAKQAHRKTLHCYKPCKGGRKPSGVHL